MQISKQSILIQKHVTALDSWCVQYDTIIQPCWHPAVCMHGVLTSACMCYHSFPITHTYTWHDIPWEEITTTKHRKQDGITLRVYCTPRPTDPTAEIQWSILYHWSIDHHIVKCGPTSSGERYSSAHIPFSSVSTNTLLCSRHMF